jgi:hypothetical protein
MPKYLHVSSSANRESIAQHGLDWTRMGSVPGIAGSPRPEVAGCFLCDDEAHEQFFVRINNTGGPVDVWEISGVTEDEMLKDGNGFRYLPRKVPPQRVRLFRQGIAPVLATNEGSRH